MQPTKERRRRRKLRTSNNNTHGTHHLPQPECVRYTQEGSGWVIQRGRAAMSQERNIFLEIFLEYFPGKEKACRVRGWEQGFRCSLGQCPLLDPRRHSRHNSKGGWVQEGAQRAQANFLPLGLGLWSRAGRQAWSAAVCRAEGRPPRSLFLHVLPAADSPTNLFLISHQNQLQAPTGPAPWRVSLPSRIPSTPLGPGRAPLQDPALSLSCLCHRPPRSGLSG